MTMEKELRNFLCGTVLTSSLCIGDIKIIGHMHIATVLLITWNLYVPEEYISIVIIYLKHPTNLLKQPIGVSFTLITRTKRHRVYCTHSTFSLQTSFQLHVAHQFLTLKRLTQKYFTISHCSFHKHKYGGVKLFFG